jgi:tetratricopeptide (TPR) repeat protein
LVYYILGRENDALVDIDRVLSLDPADNLARRMRAIIFMREGKKKAAKRDLDYCLENQCINDQSRRALRHAQRGVVYYAKMNEYAEALDDLDKALDAFPRESDAFVYRLAALAVATRAGDVPQQERRKQALIDQHQEGDLWYNRVARLFTGEQAYLPLLESTLRPLEKCAISLAEGILRERAGEIPAALSAYRGAEKAGNPHDLACILANQAADALE